MAESQPPNVLKSGRWAYVVATLAFVAYIAWITGPYLRSVIVRDAAVTSWLNEATAPIDGKLVSQPQTVEWKVGADGIIMLVWNEILSRKSLTEARIRVDHAKARVKEFRAFLDDIIALDKGRAEVKAKYADVFRDRLDEEIAGMEREISVIHNRLELIKRIAARKDKLTVSGNASQAASDEAWLRVTELEYQLVQLQKELSYAQVRREAANTGVFITHDGNDPDWVLDDRLVLKLQKKNARLELRQAEAELATAESALEVAEEDFRRLAADYVRAPPGSIVWSLKAAPGATVREGDPVAEWLDCSVLMIDVPVADAEVPLIKPGMEADVVLEGESLVRKGRVLMTRGSAFTLGPSDLAAVAKGRRNGVAQVLLEFSQAETKFDVCPVGQAAHVDFPDIGLIEIVRARLRL
jgi:biotin carboxyl carrier protein